MYTVPKLKSYNPAALEKAAEKLCAALSEEAKAIKTVPEWKAFRDRWMARKNGVLTQINDLWLKAAPKDSKREVGQRINKIRALVEDTVSKSEDIQLPLSTALRLRNQLTVSTSPFLASAARWALSTL